MRLNLYWRGRDVVDLELHLWRKREKPSPPGRGPRLQAAGQCADVTLAEPLPSPDTTVAGRFGFTRS